MALPRSDQPDHEAAGWQAAPPGPVPGRGQLPQVRTRPWTREEFEARFPDEEACAAYLEELRWSEGFACPRCDTAEGWRTDRGLWVCAECRYQASVTSGTLLAGSHLPLKAWFTAAWYLTCQDRPVSARRLQHHLGLGSYGTAWRLLHRLRLAMQAREEALSGTVEVAQMSLDLAAGATPSGPVSAVIAVAVEALEPSPLVGRLQVRSLASPFACVMADFVGEVMAPDAAVVLGGGQPLRPQAAQDLLRTGSARGDLTDLSPRVRRVQGVLDQWLRATHRRAVSLRHLDRYLAEFRFQINGRAAGEAGLLFRRLLHGAMTVDAGSNP